MLLNARLVSMCLSVRPGEFASVPLCCCCASERSSSGGDGGAGWFAAAFLPGWLIRQG